MPSLSVILRSSSLLKVSAFITAYILWSLLSDLYVIDFSCTVPVRIETKSNLTIKRAPDRITITMRGLRKHLRSLDIAALTARIILHEADPGPHAVTLNREHFLLPPCINLVSYAPANFTITTDQVSMPELGNSDSLGN